VYGHGPVFHNFLNRLQKYPIVMENNPATLTPIHLPLGLLQLHQGQSEPLRQTNAEEDVRGLSTSDSRNVNPPAQLWSGLYPDGTAGKTQFRAGDWAGP